MESHSNLSAVFVRKQWKHLASMPLLRRRPRGLAPPSLAAFPPYPVGGPLGSTPHGDVAVGMDLP
jgi:hypothetical protein